MPHIPSFAIGCFTSGAVFLSIHQQLSHRRRLTHKWALREMAEDQMRSLAGQLRASKQESTKKLTGSLELPTMEKTWNSGVSKLQDIVRGD